MKVYQEITVKVKLYFMSMRTEVIFLLTKYQVYISLSSFISFYGDFIAFRTMKHYLGGSDENHRKFYLRPIPYIRLVKLLKLEDLPFLLEYNYLLDLHFNSTQRVQRVFGYFMLIINWRTQLICRTYIC